MMDEREAAEALEHLREARRELARAICQLLELRGAPPVLERGMAELAVRLVNEYLLGLLELEEELAHRLLGEEGRA